MGILLWAGSAMADTRMQVLTPGGTVYSRPALDGTELGKVPAGDIVFVTRTEGDWAAISPPSHLGVWLNKDFVEGARVVAKSIQVRSGPGLEHDIVGTLQRGAPVLSLAEEGEWCKIAPPSSMTMWVQTSRLQAISTAKEPIREVAMGPAPTALVASPEPVAEPPPAAPATPIVAPVAPAPAPVVEPAKPIKIQPSMPKSSPSTPAASSSSVSFTPPRTLRPATDVSSRSGGSAPTKATATQPTPAQRRTSPGGTSPGLSRPAAATATSTRPAKPSAVPAPAVARNRTPAPEVYVDPELVADLNLRENESRQGRSGQVEGQLRNAPLARATPSKYRLLRRNGDTMEAICYVHGDAAKLRPYVAKNVVIRGRAYWVQEDSDLPVLVVSEIIPQSPADEVSPR